MDELTIAFKIESPPSWLPIGRTAENNWRTVEIDCSYWFNMNANGEVVLMYKPSCGMSPYPLLTERDGDNIVWRPKSGELVEGVGRLQAFFEVGTDVIGSSDMISCEVDSSLLGVDPGTDPGQTDLPWALDIIAQIAELSGHYPKIENGVLYVWDSEQEDWVQFQGGGGSATDAVLYTPQSLSDSQKAQARTNVGAGTYSKPASGIPASDLAEAVQTSLGKAETALQQHQSLAGYATETWVQNRGYQTAAQVQTAVEGVTPFVIPIVETSSGWKLDPESTLTATDIYNGIKQRDGTGSVQIAVVDEFSTNYYSVSYFTLYEEGTEDPANTAYAEFSFDIEYKNGKYIDRIVSVQAQPWEDTEFQLMIDETSKAIGTSLPAVTASDNGKFLRVVNGAWAAETVQTWQGGSY